MEYVHCIKAQKYLHPKNMKMDKKDARFARFLLKHTIYAVFAAIPFLEQNRERIEID
ncbi:MAG: hypothetical protein ACE5R7_00770 [Nitrosarchaeum sp.]